MLFLGFLNTHNNKHLILGGNIQTLLVLPEECAVGEHTVQEDIPEPENSLGGGCLLFRERNNREPNPVRCAECSFVQQHLICISKSFRTGGNQLLWLIQLLVYPISISSIQMSLYDAQRLSLHQNIIPALKSTNCWIPPWWMNCWVAEVGEPDVCPHWQRQLWSWAIYFLSYTPSDEPLPCCSKEKEDKKENLLQNKPSRSNPNKYGGKGRQGKQSTQFLPSLWAILLSPEGQDLIRTVISLLICWCYENY